jgi:hypothetical protein
MQIYEKKKLHNQSRQNNNKRSIYLRLEHCIENIFIFYIQLNFEFRRDQINFFSVSRVE